MPSEIINKNNFEQDLERYAKEIEHLLDTDLNKVIKGEEWIEIPTYDPRDDY
ncbi:MAG: hypothetical protein JKY08_10835 [Flavobacteriaceae bacterium]|nr:hypothetical protein [Flavobacteriaceae bacterium]